MKTIFLFIALFLVWCLICARWYMFSVKGLSMDLAHFNPQETTIAIVEILFMVLIAFLLGFAIAWLLRETSFKEKQTLIQELQSDISVLHNAHREQKEQILKQEKELGQGREDYMETSRENERLRTELEESRKDGIQLEKEVEVLQPKIQQSETDQGLLRFRIKQLEQQIGEKEEANKKLTAELEQCKTHLRNQHKEPVFSDFISDQLLAGISQQEDVQKRDDLKIIVGIGPGLERKLNGLGINTYKQISEWTEESIKGISAAIKFFPGRIERDRWVEQASKLYLDKLRKH